jgi:hypothetical protein
VARVVDDGPVGSLRAFSKRNQRAFHGLLAKIVHEHNIRKPEPTQ